jgi:hypothetical protein
LNFFGGVFVGVLFAFGLTKMQAPVIVMNEASARQAGRKAQTSNITAAKVRVALLNLLNR